MKQTATVDISRDALSTLSGICLALPEAVQAARGAHADFRVRKKVFAYFLNNHHGDGKIALCCKAAMGENIDRARLQPERFYLPAYIGSKGWFALRLDLGETNWDEVRQLIAQSYCLAAPKTLAARVAA